jgi:hypothetical protein
VPFDVLKLAKPPKIDKNSWILIAVMGEPDLSVLSIAATQMASNRDLAANLDRAEK